MLQRATAKKLLAREKVAIRNSARARSSARFRNVCFDPLATKLLAGEFKPGDKIKVGAKDKELVFLKK